MSGVEVACKVDRKESSGVRFAEETVGLDDVLELSCWTTSTLLWGSNPLAYVREFVDVSTSSSSSRSADIFIMMLGFAFDIALNILFDLRDGVGPTFPLGIVDGGGGGGTGFLFE